MCKTTFNLDFVDICKSLKISPDYLLQDELPDLYNVLLDKRKTEQIETQSFDKITVSE